MSDDSKLTCCDTTPPTLEQAQEIVGGYVELVSLPRGGQLLVNEDGVSMGMKPNVEASLLAGRVIVGPALLLTGEAVWK